MERFSETDINFRDLKEENHQLFTLNDIEMLFNYI